MIKNRNTISISVWTNRSQQVIEKAKEFLENIDFETNFLPNGVYDEEQAISLVFAGQYSAGKSTIMKALTGLEDIKIGEGITTEEAEIYDWNGMEIIDTPGIHTSLRPDHDEISYQTIADSDMLVYVVTHELFDSFIGEHFRKLLIDTDKAHEMILIVNKMADIGNTKENQTIKLEDLKKVTEPYDPRELKINFIDAESYLDSLEEEDEEIADELRKRSNYDGLIQTINQFVDEKSLSSRLTTSLYQILEVLQQAISKYESTTGDDDADALEEHLLQERRIVLLSQRKIEQQVKSIFQEAALKIRESGRELANSLYEYSNEDEANSAIEAAYNKVDKISMSCSEKIILEIEKQASDYKEKLEDFYNTDFSKNLQFRLEEKYKAENPLIQRLFKSDTLAQGSKKIISTTVGRDAAASGLKAFSGSNMHKVVLDVGHFFGHNFKPWEAIKWVKGINAAGKVIGVFGVVFSLGLQAKEDVDQENRQREMRSNRDKLRAGFNDAANNLVHHFEELLNGYLENNFNYQVTEIDEQIDKIRSLRIEKSDIYKILVELHDECKTLISDIHNKV